ncbi:VOC family protein [Chitinophagaceae bacterium LWZ2-11]
MQLIPYVHFNGNCEEALNTYRDIFDGTYDQINRFASAPFPTPDDYKDKVMHVQLSFAGNSIMMSDTMPDNKIEYGNGIVLSVGLTDVEKTKTIFTKLSEGGAVTMPLEKQFWGAWFGQLTDRFGIRWMFNCEG